MNKFTKFVLNNKLIILIVTLILLAGAGVGYFFVGVNSDVQSYLPDDTMTAIGKEQLNSKFGIQGDSIIGITNLEYADVEKIVTELKKAVGKETDIVDKYDDENNDLAQYKGVFFEVVWIGKFAPLKDLSAVIPSLAQSYEEVANKFVKVDEATKKTTYIINLYLNIPNTETRVHDMLNSIDVLVKDSLKAHNAIEGNAEAEYYFGGSAINARALMESSLGEMPKFLLVAVIFILLVLLFTTKSWMEPVIFLLTLGISIVLNLGSNIIFKEISSITLSASAILQLALSMDYSIFLMHSYYDEKTPLIDSKTALMRAMPKTLKAVAASALTTIGGFVALFTMRFGIGLDLGAVLAKGVLLSLLCVVCLQPIFILLFDKAIAKSQHKCLQPKIIKTTNFAIKRKTPILIICLIIAIPAFIGQFFVPLNFLTVTKGSQEPSYTEKIIQQSNNQIVVIIPDEFLDLKSKPNDAAFDINVDKHYSFVAKIKAMEDDVNNVFTMYSIIDKATLKLALATGNKDFDIITDSFARPGYTLYTFELKGGVESEQSYATLDAIKKLGNEIFGVEQEDGSYKDGIFVTGLTQGANDLSKTTKTDFNLVAIVSAIIILIILLLSFKDISLSLILLFVIELGIWINLSIRTLLGLSFGTSAGSINFMSYIIISSIQLGATVDYAILMANKYLLEKKNGNTDEISCIKNAVANASASIMVSGSVLIVACIAVRIVTTNIIVGEITLLVALGAIMSMISVMTLLPAVLAIRAEFRKRKIDKITKKAGVNMAVEDLPTNNSNVLDVNANDIEISSSDLK